MYKKLLYPLSGVLIAFATVINLFSVKHEHVSEYMGLQALANFFLIIISFSAIRTIPGQKSKFPELVRLRIKIVTVEVIGLTLVCAFLNINPLVLAGAILILMAEIISPCQYYIINNRHEELTREQIGRSILLLTNAALIYFFAAPVSAGFILFSNGLLTFISYLASLKRENISIEAFKITKTDNIILGQVSVWLLIRSNLFVFFFRIMDMLTIWAVHLQLIKAGSGDLIQYRLQTLSVALLCQIFVLKNFKDLVNFNLLMQTIAIITFLNLLSFIATQFTSTLYLGNFTKLGNVHLSIILGLIAWFNTIGFIISPHVHKIKISSTQQ